MALKFFQFAVFMGLNWVQDLIMTRRGATEFIESEFNINSFWYDAHQDVNFLTILWFYARTFLLSTSQKFPFHVELKLLNFFQWNRRLDEESKMYCYFLLHKNGMKKMTRIWIMQFVLSLTILSFGKKERVKKRKNEAKKA